jgi:hypothetical protein
VHHVVRTGRDGHQLLSDRLEIRSLRQHPTGDWHRWIPTVNSDSGRDRRIRINPKHYHLGGDHRPGVQQRRPNQPREGKHYADADQTHQQRTGHPRLWITAAEPLGSIGHADNLVWACCSQHLEQIF